MDEIKEKKNNRIYIIAFVITAIVIVVLLKTVLFTERVDGISMYPTLSDKEFMLGVSPKIRPVKRGDIVVIKANDGIVKRVIGLPGDVVKLEKESTYVNGEKLDEPYLNHEEPIEYWDMEVRVGDGEVFVMGDNRNNSFDSRQDGCYNLKDVKCVVILHTR